MPIKYPSLPKNNPKRAGERIVELAQFALFNGKKHGAITKLAEITGIDYSILATWCKGDFQHKRGRLTPAYFQKLIDAFWNKEGGIQYIEEIFELALCIGKIRLGNHDYELVDQIDRKWLENLGFANPEKSDNFPLRDSRYPRTLDYFWRTDLLKEIENKINATPNSSKVIVIYGEAGTGKTTFIEQLSTSKQWERLGEKREFFLNGRGISMHLRAWYQDLLGIQPIIGFQDKDLVVAIRKRIAGKNMFVLIDDVTSPAFVSPILDALSATNQYTVIITTSSPEIHQHHILGRCSYMTMPGLTVKEAKKLFQTIVKRSVSPHEEEHFCELVEALKGNVLGLYFSLVQTPNIGLEELVDLMHDTDARIPTEMLPQVFLPLQTAYERLPDTLKSAFTRLAAMKRFEAIDINALAALWADTSGDVSFPKTMLFFSQLQDHISPFRPSSTVKEWSLHKQTHLFALSKFDKLEAGEKEIAYDWINRLNAVYEYSDSAFESSFGEHANLGLKSYRINKKVDEKNRLAEYWFMRFWLTLFKNYNHDWEETQKELHHFHSYEYFVAYKLKQEEKNHLVNIRRWVFASLLLIGVDSFKSILPSFLTPHYYTALFIIWAIYSLWVFRYHMVAYYKCFGKWQIIWNSVTSRISDENAHSN